jgi:hypothetical protein
MCIVIFSTSFVWKIFQGDIIKNPQKSKCKVPVILARSIEFSRQIFKKSSYIKFHENPSIESQVVPCGGKTHMTKLTVANSQFSEGA